MTIQQLAKQLNISPSRLEKESLRVFLLTKLGEIEANRQKVLKRFNVESVQDWDKKLQEGKRREGGYQGISSYFNLDALDAQKNDVIKKLPSFAVVTLKNSIV